MVDIQSRLKAHNITLFEDYVVYHALNIMPVEFNQINTAYNTQDESRSINVLITKCVAREEKLKKGKNEFAHLIPNAKSSFSKGKWKSKGSNAYAPKKDQYFKRKGNNGKHGDKDFKFFDVLSSIWKGPWS